MYIAILMTCGLIVLGFINRRSTVLYICQAIWLWILTGFNSGGVDYATNESIFLRSTNKFSIGEGLSFVYTFLKKMGCNYAAYIAVTTLIAYIIIFAFIYLNAENKCLVASLMYLYPGIDFVIQKRYFLCIPILLIAIQYLNREGKKNKLIYVILVLLATLFHTSVILYFIPIMFFLIPERFRNRIIVLLGVIGLLFAKYAKKIALLLPFIPIDKIRLYFTDLSQDSSVYKFIFWCCWQMAFLLIVRWIYNWTKKNDISEMTLKSTHMLNVEFLCILPLYAFDPVFTRLYRPIVIMDYIAVTSLIRKGSTQYKCILIGVTFLLLLTIGSFYIFYVATGVGIDDMLATVFRYNIVLNQFR